MTPQRSLRTEYPHTPKQLALLVDMTPHGIKKALREQREICGEKVKFIRPTSARNSPFFISRISYIRIQRRILSM